MSLSSQDSHLDAGYGVRAQGREQPFLGEEVELRGKAGAGLPGPEPDERDHGDRAGAARRPHPPGARRNEEERAHPLGEGAPLQEAVPGHRIRRGRL